MRSSSFDCLPSLTLNSDNTALGNARCRQPITALVAKGFWNGVAEVKDALFTSANPLVVSDEAVLRRKSKFYVENESEEHKDDDGFFDEITQLYKRQTMLFQRSCEQLTDIYQVGI